MIIVTWIAALLALVLLIVGWCSVVTGALIDKDCPEGASMMCWGLGVMIVAGLALGGAAEKLL